MLESRKWSGHYPSWILWLKILVRCGDIVSIAACSTKLGIPSGPGTLLAEVPCIAFCTSCTVIGGKLIWSVYVALAMSSRSASGGAGKNDSLSILAFPSGSSTASPVDGSTNVGVIADSWLCLVRAHFATFHSDFGDSAAFSTLSLCMRHSVRLMVLDFWFLARR